MPARKSSSEAPLRLECRISGDPAGRPTVLLHALGNTGRSWDRLVSALSPQKRRLYVPDLRGHGLSPRADAYTFELMYEDVMSLIDGHRLGAVDLVGHSMGGHVAWLIAQRHPSRVRKLVIEDTPPPPRDAAAEAELRERSRGAGGHGPVISLYQEFRELRRTGELDSTAVRPIIDGLRKVDPGWWQRLGQVTAETLVISGGLSSPVPRALLAEVAEAVPRGRLLAIDAGHYVHRTEPDRFCAEVARFLG
ncbi:alpha/beta hydrolase [Streptomyces nitrosporeus]|uniref:Alpha/beta hydrolase n=1 Tax=Streptomyces nitrosporeus TaxID=28894 RepID=A0A5J6F8W8_9ACTN|nr:alpha/beta hydrolase [Streptomyces nitrosporeus]QEU72722.1 alpha/beta hydrolase [Streptomyces nitrosporeus]